MPIPFRIKQPISIEASTKKEDVVKTKEALRTLGLYRGPVNGIADHELSDGLRAFVRCACARRFRPCGGPVQLIEKPQLDHVWKRIPKTGLRTLSAPADRRRPIALTRKIAMSIESLIN